MNTQGKIRNVLFFVVLATYSMLLGLEPGDLKGVYSYIKPEYHHLIPTALIRENNFLESIYCAGHKDCGTALLVRELYHRVPGNFKISDGSEFILAYYFTEKTVGHILGAIEEYAGRKERKDSWGEDELKGILTDIIKNHIDTETLTSKIGEAQGKLLKVAKDLIQSEKDLKNFYDLQKTIYNELQIKDEIPTIIKNGCDYYVNKLPLVQEPQQQAKKKKASTPRERIKDSFKKIPKTDVVKLLAKSKALKEEKESLTGLAKILNKCNKMALFIVTSLDECGYFKKEKAIFPSDVTRKILQAFAFEKMEQKKQLVGYFKSMEDSLFGKNEKSEQPEKFIAENATFPAGCYTYEEFKKFSGTAETRVVDLSEEELLYALTFEFFYNGALPKIITYKSDALYQKLPFPDCMETTLRNLFNICFFAKDNPFDLNKCTKELKEFYGDNPSQVDMSDPDQHNRWTAVVPNMPYVEYHRVLDVNTKKQDIRGLDIKNDTLCRFIYGFEYTEAMNAKPITIFGDPNSFHEITINNKKFIHVDQKKIDNTYKLFEVMPTLKNAIIILNHHLNLGLFKKDTIAVDFFEKKFCEKFLPKLCEKLDWTIDTTKTAKTTSDIESYNVVVFIKTKSGALFSINTQPIHGWVKKESTDQRSEFWNAIAEQMFKRGNKENNSDLLSFVAVDKDKIFSSDYNIDKAFKYYQFFMQQIGDENKALEVVKWFLNNAYDNDNALKQGFDKFIEDCFCYLVGKFPVNADLYYQKELVGFIDNKKPKNRLAMEICVVAADEARTGIKKNYKTSALQLFEKLVEKEYEKIFGEAAIEAKNGTIAKYSNARKSALNLFEKLVEKGVAYKEAVEAAKKGIQDTVEDVKKSALNLFEKLVDKKQAYTEAAGAAKSGIEDTSEKVGSLALELFEKLFTIDEAKKEAFSKAAAAAAQSKFELELFKKLVDNGYTESFSQAANAAKTGVRSSFSAQRDSAFQLFESLVEKKDENAFSKAAEAAASCINDADDDVRASAVKLLKELFKIDKAKNYAFSKAAEAAASCSNNKNDDIRNLAIKLLKELFEIGEAKNEAFGKATEAAKQGINNKREGVRISALGLFVELVEKGQAYKEAAEAAKNCINDEDFNVINSALELFVKLVEKGKAYKEAAEAAKNCIKNKFGNVSDFALELFVKLVEKGQVYVFTDATNAAVAGFESLEKDNINLAVDLFKKLFEQKEAKENALTAARKIVKTNVNIRVEYIQDSLKSLQKLITETQKKIEETKE